MTTNILATLSNTANGVFGNLIEAVQFLFAGTAGVVTNLLGSSNLF